jgi:hypothetical protein
MLGGTATRQHISTLWLHKLAESGGEKTRAIQLAKEHAVLFDNVGASPFSLRGKTHCLKYSSAWLYGPAHLERLCNTPRERRRHVPGGPSESGVHIVMIQVIVQGHKTPPHNVPRNGQVTAAMRGAPETALQPSDPRSGGPLGIETSGLR